MKIEQSHLCTEQRAELARRRRNAMTRGSVLQREQQTRNDVGSGVGTKVLCKECQSVDERVKCGELHEKGLQRGQYQKERRGGSEPTQLQAPQTDFLRVEDREEISR